MADSDSYAETAQAKHRYTDIVLGAQWSAVQLIAICCLDQILKRDDGAADQGQSVEDPGL